MMEENNRMKEEQYQLEKETLKEDMMDLLNVVQLLEMALENNEEDEHIIRSVSLIGKMIKGIINNNQI